MADVFISYSHKDGDFAHRLAAEIKRHQIEVWIDDRIDYGDQWPHVIQDNLAACRVFIVIMSTNAFNSMWVQNEVSYAQANDKDIFPLLYEGEVWLSLASTHYVHIHNGEMPPEKFFEKLKKSLGQPVPMKQERLPEKPKKRRAGAARSLAFIVGLLLLFTALSRILFPGLWEDLFATPTRETKAPVEITTSAPPEPPITEEPPTEPPITEEAPTDPPAQGEEQPEPTPPEESITEAPPPPDEFTIDDFSLAVGDERIYLTGLTTETIGPIVKADPFHEWKRFLTESFTERVVELEGDSNEIFRIYRVERSGNTTGLDCNTGTASGEIITLWYITDATRLFTACTEEERTQIVDGLLNERWFGKSPPSLSAPTIIFPIWVNNTWNWSKDIPPQDNMNIWVVEEEFESIQTLTEKYNHCFRMSMQADQPTGTEGPIIGGFTTARFVCEGVGLVAWEYHSGHFPKFSDFYGELSSYSPSGQP